MQRGKPSGYVLTEGDVGIVLGMQSRGDRNHDIAAWFGVNQGRVKEAKDGKFGSAMAAPESKLPPKGPPGIKGRHLRDAARAALKAFDDNDPTKAQTLLRAAVAAYDANDT
jgi:hypothetical protein